jgi:hypothetical protein
VFADILTLGFSLKSETKMHRQTYDFSLFNELGRYALIVYLSTIGLYGSTNIGSVYQSDKNSVTHIFIRETAPTPAAVIAFPSNLFRHGEFKHASVALRDPHNRASYKFTVRHQWRNKNIKERGRILTNKFNNSSNRQS